MNYMINDADILLDKKMSTPEGKSIIIDLQGKIEEEEQQLDLFSINTNHCKCEISKIDPVLKQANDTLLLLRKQKKTNLRYQRKDSRSYQS